MTNCNCNCTCRCSCALVTLIVGVILGVVAAFLQITGGLTIPTAFLWASVGAAAVYLAVLLRSICCCRCDSVCLCTNLKLTLLGILGSILLGVILLLVGITATSVVSAILVGLLVLSLTVLLGGAACYVRSALGCGD